VSEVHRLAHPQTPSFAEGRHAGVLLPLFSCPSTRSWGIGEISDLPIVARWLRAAGLDLIQMLPVNEMAFGQTSPYSALSAMAIDPLYISLEAVPEFQMLGGEASLSPETRARLDMVRRSPGVAYAEVRSIKDEALRAVYTKFVSMFGDGRTTRKRPRVAAFEKFRKESRWWLEDYALFRALHEHHEHRAWWTWDPALQARERAALDRVRAELADEIRYYEFLQWLAADQWRAAREASAPVGLFGDLPFMVGADSADVWANQEMFARDLSVGTPPDAFSATGQDWGLPAYRWDAMGAADFRWLRDRARRARELFDGFRVDHVIGFYRTYVRPIPLPGQAHEGAAEGGVAAVGDANGGNANGGDATAAVSKAFFTPAEEHHQRGLGEHIIGLFRESGAYIIAEDLGTVPDFVRESLARLDVPGYRVLRWEREWNQPGQPFRQPARYPARSLATTGTHDTDPLAIAWDDAPPDERRAIGELASLSDVDRDFDHDIRDAVLKLLYASGSDLLVIPIQDLFGWRDRINTPATVGDTNWTWRLPWPVDRLDAEPAARERAATLRQWAASTSRSSALLSSPD
jgi:4-alpha-glucanotransferase